MLFQNLQCTSHLGKGQGLEQMTSDGALDTVEFVNSSLCSVSHGSSK